MNPPMTMRHEEHIDLVAAQLTQTWAVATGTLQNEDELLDLWLRLRVRVRDILTEEEHERWKKNGHVDTKSHP